MLSFVAPFQPSLFAPDVFRAQDAMLARLASGLTASSRLRAEETEAGYTLEAELPGVKPSDVEVTVKDDGLTIVAKSRTHQLNHSLTLPADADAEKAAVACENGILRIEVPKKEAAEPLAPFEIGLVEPDALPAEDEGHYRQTLAAPGVAPTDLKIAFTGDGIEVEGRTEAHGRAYGVRRRFALPRDADVAGATAALAHGILTLVVPKRAKPEPRLLPVAESAAAAAAAAAAAEDDFQMC